MAPEELLKEVGEPTCRVSTTGIITNQTNAPLEPGLELYTADQLIAARKGLEDQLAKAEQRVAEACALQVATEIKFHWLDAARVAKEIRSGEWRKFVKEVN